MKPVVLAVSTAIALLVVSSASFAGPIERACMNSDRKFANRSVCGCIQQVADQTLRGSDQRKAASFFRDPDRAQEVRMSKSDRDNEFWDRYRAFGDQAEAFCAG